MTTAKTSSFWTRQPGTSTPLPYPCRTGKPVSYTHLDVYKRQVWWNPYNVDMKFQGAEGGPWGSFFGEHRYMPLMQMCIRDRMCSLSMFSFVIRIYSIEASPYILSLIHI